jgi:hypothetical protein
MIQALLAVYRYLRFHIIVCQATFHHLDIRAILTMLLEECEILLAHHDREPTQVELECLGALASMGSDAGLREEYSRSVRLHCRRRLRSGGSWAVLWKPWELTKADIGSVLRNYRMAGFRNGR